MLAYLKKIYGGSRSDFFDLARSALANEQKMFVITANPETFMTAQRNEIFHDVVMSNEALIVPDGIGVVKAMRQVNLPVKERIPGVELSRYLLEEAAKLHKSVCFFGAKQEVLDALTAKCKEKYPTLCITGAFHGYFKDRDAIFDQIVQQEPDLVLVALGIPEQEMLIYRRLRDFHKGVFIGVGGSFDVLSGMKKRAPKIFIKLNLEWLYRIVKEPKRLKRFFESNVKFFSAVRKEYREECRHAKN